MLEWPSHLEKGQYFIIHQRIPVAAEVLHHLAEALLAVIQLHGAGIPENQSMKMAKVRKQ